MRIWEEAEMGKTRSEEERTDEWEKQESKEGPSKPKAIYLSYLRLCDRV